MLVETQIRFAIPDLSQEELDEIIAQACAAMSRGRLELHEPVSLQATTALSAGCIAFLVRGLCSRAEREYVYNRQSRELFAYNADCSHLDLDKTRYLKTTGKLKKDPGF